MRNNLNRIFNFSRYIFTSFICLCTLSLYAESILDITEDDFVIGDLRDPLVVAAVVDDEMDEIYQLAADMGGAGFVFTGENDADIMHNSALINLNIAHEAAKKSAGREFYSSSACTYPEHNQLDPDNPNCVEHSAYPANPDSEYGWEKLFIIIHYMKMQ